MSKSVYSLVLTDEVVEEIDRLACTMNTSRSNLINQLLAERVSYVTPEMRMNDIFGGILSLMDGGGFNIQQTASDSTLSIRSALKYKYKPTIRYSLELQRGGSKTIGELKVSLRTQSEQLIADLNRFVRLWAELENRYVIGFFPEGITYRSVSGGFTRTFRLPADKETLPAEEIGHELARYIKLFDEVLKAYFAQLGDYEAAEKAAVSLYREHLKKGIVII